ncbi:hypothetical protein HPB47_000264 [Ixodes persulcatus]|uniref:Uncharacterized protein n=1 Tax=Ixodes persulcatus TaxID=34615 RepID=A0AC60PSC0_IXOPE|nr:hypothetical protein HPB47_000264 [Ixodes persulcatus]
MVVDAEWEPLRTSDLQKLLSAEELGYRRPTQFLQHLQHLLGDKVASIDDAILRRRQNQLCSSCHHILTDGWTNVRGDSIWNFVVDTPKYIFYYALLLLGPLDGNDLHYYRTNCHKSCRTIEADYPTVEPGENSTVNICGDLRPPVGILETRSSSTSVLEAIRRQE